MKIYILTFCISESKLNAMIARKATQAGKDQIKKLFPVLPLAFTLTNRKGDITDVDNWTRPIKSKLEKVKTEKGYIFYKVELELPNYISKNQKKYELEFEKFVRDYIAKQNSLVGLLLITGKFSGSISVVSAIKDTVVENKENYVDNSISQIKEQATDYADFYKKHKKLIIGGSVAVGVLIVIVIIKK